MRAAMKQGSEITGTTPLQWKWRAALLAATCAAVLLLLAGCEPSESRTDRPRHSREWYLNGAAVLVEHPERIAREQLAPGATVVEQAGGSENWFYFAPTTPVAGSEYLGSVNVVAELQGAAVEDVKIFVGEHVLWTIEQDRVPIASDWITPERVEIQLSPGRNSAHSQGDGGIVLALRIKFLRTPGRVIFKHARFYYSER